MFWCLSLAWAEPPTPALVTSLNGPVVLVDGAARGPAPAPPFLLSPTQRLEVSTGGRVVLLRQGGAFAIDGPRTVDPSALVGTAAPDAVSSLLGKKTSLAVAGAARASGPALLRPVPGAPALALTEVRWRCDACEAATVELVNTRTGETLWSGSGQGHVAYGGAPLSPGAYGLVLSGRTFGFAVLEPSVVEPVLAAAHIHALPEADRPAALAGAYLLAGLPTDALRVADEGGDHALVTAIEAAVGVAP